MNANGDPRQASPVTEQEERLTDIFKDYFDALERLKCGKPANVPKGTKISNDSVSLEAGRKKGTIKKSRPVFSDLIEAINAAALTESKPQDEMRERLNKAKSEGAKYRALWEESLAREVSLFKELWDAREAWAKEREAMASGKVTSIRAPGAKSSRSHSGSN
ncbi:hypothetical protein D7I39_21785 [Allopusillimonas ginsengisoli]|nr:hypothetical protein D7I39_21785 [Allopusillimonas ginsengisoli]